MLNDVVHNSLIETRALNHKAKMPKGLNRLCFTTLINWVADHALWDSKVIQIYDA